MVRDEDWNFALQVIIEISPISPSHKAQFHHNFRGAHIVEFPFNLIANYIEKRFVVVECHDNGVLDFMVYYAKSKNRHIDGFAHRSPSAKCQAHAARLHLMYFEIRIAF